MTGLYYLRFVFDPAVYILYLPLAIIPIGVLFALAMIAYSIGMKKYYWIAPVILVVTFIIYIIVSLFTVPIPVYQ